MLENGCHRTATDVIRLGNHSHNKIFKRNLRKTKNLTKCNEYNHYEMIMAHPKKKNITFQSLDLLRYDSLQY